MGHAGPVKFMSGTRFQGLGQADSEPKPALQASTMQGLLESEVWVESKVQMTQRPTAQGAEGLGRHRGPPWWSHGQGRREKGWSVRSTQVGWGRASSDQQGVLGWVLPKVSATETNKG